MPKPYEELVMIAESNAACDLHKWREEAFALVAAIDNEMEECRPGSLDPFTFYLGRSTGRQQMDIILAILNKIYGPFGWKVASHDYFGMSLTFRRIKEKSVRDRCRRFFGFS